MSGAISMEAADCLCVGDADEALAATAKALAHPARLAILRTIAKKERCNCAHICSALPLAQSTVSQHLKVLRDAGLIVQTSDGPNSRYAIRADAFARFSAGMGELADGLCTGSGACCG